MARRAALARVRARFTGRPDIVLTHAPIRGVGDQEDLSHRGFACFRSLAEDCRPRYFIHGHVHKRYMPDFRRVRSYGETTVINACGYHILEFDP